MELRDLIFKKISEKHPGWNMEAFAMAKTDKERWEELGPPPTVPHKRSQLSLGPYSLFATEEEE